MPQLPLRCCFPASPLLCINIPPRLLLLRLPRRVDMTSEATAAKDAAAATTTFSLKPQHADGPDVMLVFR